MPPNALFDVFCIFQSVTDIIARAAAIQARQSSAILQRRAHIKSYVQSDVGNLYQNSRRSKLEPTGQPLDTGETPEDPPVKSPQNSSPEPLPPASIHPLTQTPHALGHEPPLFATVLRSAASAPGPPIPPPLSSRAHISGKVQSDPPGPGPNVAFLAAEPTVTLTASKVPSSQLGRLFHYGSLAAGLGMGAASEIIRRSTGNSETESGSLLLSPSNVSRLVNKLSKMRGAALKLGQFMSIQDSHLLPEQLDAILRRVQAGAHYMPNWQMEKVLTVDLGAEWRSNFASFDAIPFASASIGQVHRATLASHVAPDLPFRDVAIKVQFPNIKSSIHSDLKSLSMLLYASRLLPRGLFLDKTLAAMERELEDECDYLREAHAARKFREGLEGDDRFTVMRVVDDLCTKNVLTMERLDGVPIIRVLELSQQKRDQIATDILSLCLRELFTLRFMQTDPNWSNFLYNQKTDKIELIDFGASRSYSKEFMDDWYLLLSAAVRGDREACKKYSLKLGYLTGEESPEMLDAHVQSVLLLGQPFSKGTPQPFAFAPSAQGLTSKIRELIPFMLKHRLTPPPRETYSLNRKLSGAFLLCERLGANVDCRAVWEREAGLILA